MVVSANFVFNVAERRQRRLQYASAASLGFDEPSFAMALAEFTGVLPKYVALDVGDTHAPGVGVLAFNVNSRFVLNFASQADFADSVASKLASMTMEELEGLLGPAMLARGLEIVSVEVSGPDTILVYPSPPPPFTPWPIWPPIGIQSALEATEGVRSQDLGTLPRDAGLVTAFCTTFLIPIALVYLLYRVRREMETKAGPPTIEDRRSSRSSHVVMRRRRAPPARHGAGDPLERGALALKGSWFNVSANGLQEQSLENVCCTPGGRARAGNDAIAAPGVDTPVVTPVKAVVDATGAMPVAAPAVASAERLPRTPTHRSHIELRRRRLSRPSANPFARSLELKGAWFNASVASLRSAAEDPMSEIYGSCEDDGSPSQGATYPSCEEMSASANISLQHADLAGHASPVPTGGSISPPAASPADAEQLEPAGTIEPGLGSADASFVDELRRGAEGLTHVSPDQRNTPDITPPSPSQLQMIARSNAAAARFRELEANGQRPDSAEGAGESAATQAPALEASPEDKATLRSEAVLARARARARAKAKATAGLEVAPKSPALVSQQQWLQSVMGAVSAQEDEPRGFQHDWLAMAIEHIEPEPSSPEQSVQSSAMLTSPRSRPNTPRSRPNTPRSQPQTPRSSVFRGSRFGHDASEGGSRPVTPRLPPRRCSFMSPTTSRVSTPRPDAQSPRAPAEPPKPSWATETMYV